MKRFIMNAVPIGGSGGTLDLQALRDVAKSDPALFAQKVHLGVEQGKLTIAGIRDWKGLFAAIADVQIPIEIEIGGSKRAVMASAFPILTGTTAIAAINDAYNAVPSIGEQLVTDLEDNKKVTTIAAVYTLDTDIDEVKEGRDFPEIGTDEEKVEIRHKRNGRIVKITAEMIEENEAADIVSRINGVGEIAGEWVEEQTLYRITDHFGCAATPAEPYVYRPAGTGTQLYNHTANNPGTRAPSGTRIQNNALVDDTDLDAARTVLRAMKNARGRRINIPWSEVMIVVPDALEGKLMKIVNSELVPGVENEVSNWGPRGKYYISLDRIKSSPKMDDMSMGAWYIGAFKRQFARKWKLQFEYVTLGTDTQAYLNARIAAQFRIAWDMEVGARDYVYCVQCLAATTAPADE